MSRAFKIPHFKLGKVLDVEIADKLIPALLFYGIKQYMSDKSAGDKTEEDRQASVDAAMVRLRDGTAAISTAIDPKAGHARIEAWLREARQADRALAGANEADVRAWCALRKRNFDAARATWAAIATMRGDAGSAAIDDDGDDSADA